ncbi:hypothetical protein J2S74_004460 [Evansella vedderi]|uniref:YufK family protein n=1 Tax=Evansella vedderi TaxID=38282 RepID=A0ABU0A191_9BACI|nr:DUF5366 family protein [Evansella vedderi]MDQ0257015.1 hypothetical protein [Evansella vedderi]
MKNAYLTSHFPFISIVLFSLSFSIFTSRVLINYLENIGLYMGMTEFFSEQGILLTLLFLLWLFFFMLFSALKLIADTINELSLLFFSKDVEGSELQSLRGGTWIFLWGGLLSLGVSFQLSLLVLSFLVTCFVYFIFFVYQVSPSLSYIAVAGMVFFHLFFWFTFLLAVAYALLRLYNSVIASLPV